jgi:hypothetical protein
LVVRVVGDRSLDERDGAGGLAQFLQQEDRVGRAPGQPVGAGDADDVAFALAGGVAEAVAGGRSSRAPEEPSSMEMWSSLSSWPWVVTQWPGGASGDASPDGVGGAKPEPNAAV